MAALTSACSLSFPRLASFRPHATVYRRKLSHSNVSPDFRRKLLSPGSVTVRIPRLVPRSAASSPAMVSSPPPEPWRGAALKHLLASIAAAAILWFVPPPPGVPQNAWRLVGAITVGINIIITPPFPLGAVALMGLGACVLTKTISWLFGVALFFARGFIKTGLGNRIAYQFVSFCRSSSVGLGNSLVFSEALLAPTVPSVSVRAAAIFLRLVKTLCLACGSNVGDGTEGLLGSGLAHDAWTLDEKIKHFHLSIALRLNVIYICFKHDTHGNRIDNL